MITILRTAAQIADAPSADLVATYNALTGKAIKKFETRAVAERRVEMALMAAADAAGHLGVPKGSTPAPLTAAERAAKGEIVNPLLALDGAADSKPVTGSQDGPGLVADEPAQASAPADAPATPADENPYRPGTMSHGLWLATRSVELHSKADKPTRAPGAPAPTRRRVTAVQATLAGKSRLQAESLRCKLLRWIEAQPDRRATVDAAVLQDPGARGHIQKLIDAGWLVVTAQEPV